MARYIDPSTDEAKFVKGTLKNGRLGARLRQTEEGELSGSKEALANAKAYGLPGFIRGNPLGCGCQIAHLVSAGPVINGQIEANYHCDSQWKNYVVFQVRQQVKQKKREVKLDKMGNLIGGESFQAGELEEL